VTWSCCFEFISEIVVLVGSFNLKRVYLTFSLVDYDLNKFILIWFCTFFLF